MSDEETAPPTDPGGLTDPASLKAIVQANWTARSAAWDRWSDTTKRPTNNTPSNYT